MPRVAQNRRSTGVVGLYFDENEDRYRIDYRWKDPRTHELHRYKERLAKGVNKATAVKRGLQIINLATAGELRQKGDDIPGTLKEALKRYLDTADLSERARKDRKRHVDLLTAELNRFPLVDLAPIHLERYKRKRAETPIAPRGKKKQQEKMAAAPSKKLVQPATINRELATFKHFVGKAEDWGWIDAAQAKKLRKVKLLKEPPGRVRWLSDEEREKLYGTLPEGFRRLVLADVLSGARRGEIVGLKKKDVDLKKRSLAFVKTKSGKRRDVPINDALADVLKAAMTASEGEYVFESRHRVPYTPNGVSSFFKKKVKEAGIVDFHLHDLRHDFATQVRRAGHGLDVIQALLGHSTILMTQRYAHIGREELVRAVASLDQKVSPNVPPGSEKDTESAASGA